MRKTLVTLMVVFMLIAMCFFTTSVYAANETVLDQETEGEIVEAIEKSKKDIEYYKEKYGTYFYGFNKLYLLMEEKWCPIT